MNQMYDTINCLTCSRPLSKELEEYKEIEGSKNVLIKKYRLALCCQRELMCRRETTAEKYGLPPV